MMGLTIILDGDPVTLDAETEAEILEALTRQERAKGAQAVIDDLAARWTSWKQEGGAE